MAGISLTSAGMSLFLSVGGESMLRPQQPPPFLRTSLLAARASGGGLCSNYNYKPQTESHQPHLALYANCHLRSVAIMIEVTSRHMECTHFN